MSFLHQLIDLWWYWRLSKGQLSFTDTNISSDSQAISLMIFSPRNGHRHGFKRCCISWMVGKFHNEDEPSSQPLHATTITYTGMAIINIIKYTDSKVHGTSMGPTWVLLAPGRPNVGTMNLAIRVWAAHDDVIKWKHFPPYWPFVWGIHRTPVNSAHKGQWRGAWMFSLIYVWINGWVNNLEAGDWRRYRSHYDVIVMP